MAASCGAAETEEPAGKTWSCVIPAGEKPDYAQQIGCEADFLALSARPLDASIPGARSAKTVIDKADSMALYFTDTNCFPLHYDFALAHLSGNGLPPVGDIGQFNSTEYYSPNRRFLLGAVTWYDQPGVWTYEIAPYDTSSAQMAAEAYALIRDASFFGPSLYFHPTSSSVESILPELPASVRVITSNDLFAGMTYQPLNLGEALGQLRFVQAADLGKVYVGPRDVVVLDHVPNDIAVVAGIITEDLQTPLSHINVLSQNRGTPNMARRGAFDDSELRAMENGWVRLVVGPFEYRVEPVAKEEADAWWEEHKPPAVQVPDLDLGVTDLRDIEEVTIEDIPAFGGKASHYGELTRIELAPGGDGVEPTPLPVLPGFGVPVYYYKQFEQENGFDAEIAGMLQDEQFENDPAYRDERLALLRSAMRLSPINPDFEAAVLSKIATDFPGVPMRFRSSTNAEDLDGFTGAGLYTSKTGDPNDPSKPVRDAIREVWASLWNFRAFEERTARSIPHTAVAMALLVHPSYTDEEANGVALTGNMFDPVQPAFYVNVQLGEASVVQPDEAVTVDSFLYYFYYAGQPITFLSRSSLVGPGETVLTVAQTYELGQGLHAIHQYFAPIYQQGNEFFAMDVEFKFDDLGQGGTPKLWVKQARPHYGWGSQPTPPTCQ